MKKVGLIVASMVAAGTVAMAASPVYSVNTVGFQKLGVASNFNMVAVNWNQVGGSDTVTIQKFLDTSTLTGGSLADTSDMLYVWDPTLNGGTGGYTSYYFYDSGAAVPGVDRQWYDVSNDASPTTNTLKRGDAAWLRHRGATTTAVAAGEVPTSLTNVVTFAAGFSLFGSAYTAPLALNGANNTWLSTGGSLADTSDRIYVWDATLAGVGGYKTYYFYDSGAAVPGVDRMWYDVSNDAVPTTDVIPMGAGAWYRALNAGTVWREAKPY